MAIAWVRRHLRAVKVGGAAAIACLTLALTGCGPVPPGQLLKTTANDLEHLRSYRVSGGLYVGQDRIVLSADVLSDGDASGTIEVEDVQAKFVVAHNVSYFSTLSLPITGAVDPSVQPMLEALHPAWWQAPGSTAAQAALAMVVPRNFVSQFLQSNAGFVESAAHDRHGRAAIALTSYAGNVFVSTATAPQVLEVTTSTHYISSSNLTNVDLVVDHLNERLIAPTAAGALPMDNLDALPPYFTVAASGPTGCDTAGCTVSATVTAAVGHGTLTAHLGLFSSSKELLATCSTPVSIAAVGQSATVSCRATGSAWTSFVYNGNPADTFREGAAVDPAAVYGPATPLT